MNPNEIEAVARRLDRAWRDGSPIQPPSESEGLSSPEDAYAIQRRWAEIRRDGGERTVGYKIGLTSAAMREQLGVSEPDYGSVWEVSTHRDRGGKTTLAHDRFLQPMVEAELAFLLGEQLPEGEISAEQVLAATEAVSPCFEIIDSRIEDWRIALVDTIADNASYGALVLGQWSAELARADLGKVQLRVSHNGAPASEGLGSAALGHPAYSVAWLVNKLRSYGEEIAAGDVVLSGALARAIPASAEDSLTVATPGQRSLTVRFE